MTTATALPHVVILGGGFAGLYAARALKRAPVRITVIDRRNHHLFQPLLYQVATAALDPSQIAAPLRGLLRWKNAQVLLADAVAIDAPGKRVVLADGEVSYDYLIVATGATHSYFGHDEWSQVAPGLKTVEDALDIRRRVLLAYEAAERTDDPELRRELMTFVIVGGGPTGVELAGALGEISHQVLANDFRNIDPTQSRVVLLEGLPRILNAFPEDLGEKAKRSLERLGVEVRTGARVTGIDKQGVSLGEERLPARTVLWGAGVAASPLARSLGAPLDRAGRVKVTPELTVPGRNDVFVVGDLALIEQDGQPVPGVAPAAMQMGTRAARNILRLLRGEPPEPFRYWDRGTFAVIGRGHAVGIVFGKTKMSGFLAWLAWLFIHIMFLIGFRSRVVVLINWAYSYVAVRRG
ncbi:MAG TPA: NAD(P)/FAD-dependent oxidoreductase, partial [Myxococcaceae bacterium]|nr:NAD(P)/FAD-dependent oxidoreductase [Myxococcaceae bacterium]